MSKYLATKIQYSILKNYESNTFKCWEYNKDFYILHKPSGVIISFLPGKERIQNCNKNIPIEMYQQFIELFLVEINKLS